MGNAWSDIYTYFDLNEICRTFGPTVKECKFGDSIFSITGSTCKCAKKIVMQLSTSNLPLQRHGCWSVKESFWMSWTIFIVNWAHSPSRLYKLVIYYQCCVLIGWATTIGKRNSAAIVFSFQSKRFSLLVGYYNIYRKIPKISPEAYIFQWLFLRGLILEGLIFGGAYLRREICVYKSIGLAL